MIKQVIRIDGMDTAEVLFETVTASCRDIPLYRVVFPLGIDPKVICTQILKHITIALKQKGKIYAEIP